MDVSGPDANVAIIAGCRAVYVSNHGGRQLDGVYPAVSSSITDTLFCLVGLVQ